ncbi:hypothetical protein FRC03_011543 [Tulasnella sp. 419]|nr:hypothetical protein FRC03_011543 [Tulasnella sp. 419]
MFDDDETLRTLHLDSKIEYNLPKHYSGFSNVCSGKLITESGNIEVAIKVLRLKKSNNSVSTRPDDQRFAMRFKREVLLWRRLKHRNIVPLLGYVTHPSDLPAMVSPWYSNGNVIEYLAQQRDPNRTSLASDVVRALRYLHSIPVVHGDIKGENVLVDISGSASLCDFGLSQFVEDTDQIHGFTTTNAYTGGTDLYLSPELVNGEGKTTMSDMWALGCLIVLILTDHTPHHAINNRLKLLMAITAGDAPHKTRNMAINEGLWGSLTRCWSTAPLERPDISQIAAQFIPSSDLMDDGEEDIHFNASNSDAAVNSRNLQPGQLMEHYAGIKRVDFSPDGAYLSVTLLVGTGYIWKMKEGRFAFHSFIDGESPTPPVPIWFSTSNRFMTHSRTEIRIWTNEEHAKPFTVEHCIQTQMDIRSVTWLPDGNNIACVEDSLVHITDLTGSISATYRSLPRGLRKMEFSPNGNMVLLTCQAEAKSEIIVYDTSRPWIRHSCPLSYEPECFQVSTDGKYILSSSKQAIDVWYIETTNSRDTKLSPLHSYVSKSSDHQNGKTAFGGDRERSIVSISHGGLIHVWDRDSASCLYTFQTGEIVLLNPEIAGLSWNNPNIDTMIIATLLGDHDNQVQVWAVRTQSSPPRIVD